MLKMCRIGWLICYNNRKMLSEVWQGALKLTTVILGANTIVQPALKVILTSPKGNGIAKYFINLFKVAKMHKYCISFITH